MERKIERRMRAKESNEEDERRKYCTWDEKKGRRERVRGKRKMVKNRTKKRRKKGMHGRKDDKCYEKGLKKRRIEGMHEREVGTEEEKD